MSWYHGGLSRTLSVVPVHPLYRNITNAKRLQLHRTSFFGDHRGIVLGSFSVWFLKNLAHRCPAQRQL